MHVLIVPSYYPTATAPGSGVFVREQVSALTQAGVTVGVIHPDLRTVTQLRPGALRETHLQLTEETSCGASLLTRHGWSIPPVNRRLSVLMARQLFRRYVARHGRPDVLHAHTSRWGGFMAHDLSRRTGIPYVITEHSTSFLIEGRAQDTLLRTAGDVYADAASVLAVSSTLADGLRPLRADCEVVPNVVDTDFFGPGSAPAADDFHVVSIGWLIQRKRFDLLIDAFADAFADVPAARLSVVGTGPLREGLAAQARSRGIGDRVSLTGRLDRSGVRDLLQGAALLASTSEIETFGVTLIEGMSTGLPFLATPSGGPQTIWFDGAGEVVGDFTVGSVAAGLRRAYERRLDRDPAHRAMLRERVVGTYGYAAVAARLSELYARVVASRP